MDQKGRRGRCRCLTGLAIGTASVPLTGTSGWLMVAARHWAGQRFRCGHRHDPGRLLPDRGPTKILGPVAVKLSDSGTLTAAADLRGHCHLHAGLWCVWAIAARVGGLGSFAYRYRQGPPVTRDAALHPPTSTKKKSVITIRFTFGSRIIPYPY